MQIIECVPNFSEGRDMAKMKEITDAIAAVPGVKLLDVDPGKATNRTVVTIVGEPENVIEGAFQGIKKAMEVIDMSKHSGEHPRMGATDVCPFIPIANITMEETAKFAHQLAKRVGEELDLPIYMYESAATSTERKNLATIRAGEYEGFGEKIKTSQWKPDYGPSIQSVKSGVTAIGARDFLVAYNVNLNTSSVRRANSIAFDVRENGRVKREGNPITGKVVNDDQGNPLREPGMCPSVKAIGWFIEEYNLAQISMNLTDLSKTSLHEAFEACRTSANDRGLRVTGSELVGLVPLNVLLDAGKYFLRKQQRSTGISEREILHIAVKSLGLDELAPFDLDQKVIEYKMNDDSQAALANMKLNDFANMTASENPAPGGGSISAYVGALGASLGAMVGNLSAHKRGWDDRWEFYSDWAVKGQDIKAKLLKLVDEDTLAFNQIMDAIRLPKKTEEDKATRKQAMLDATKNAIQTPLDIMRVSFQSYELLEAMANQGLKASISDAGVGTLCTRTAIEGAMMNVKINLSGFEDAKYKEEVLAEANKIQADSFQKAKEIIAIVEQHIS
ncbi:glutamate formimidoyltransferase [Saprospiraceae bacterium]|nr:glutamate formimidoyltransferase [Saprospiraceae bacterium]